MPLYLGRVSVAFVVRSCLARLPHNIHARAVKAVFARDVLPEGSTNLVTALTGLKMNLFDGRIVSATVSLCCARLRGRGEKGTRINKGSKQATTYNLAHVEMLLVD